EAGKGLASELDAKPPLLDVEPGWRIQVAQVIPVFVLSPDLGTDAQREQTADFPPVPMAQFLPGGRGHREPHQVRTNSYRNAHEAVRNWYNILNLLLLQANYIDSRSIARQPMSWRWSSPGHEMPATSA